MLAGRCVGAIPANGCQYNGWTPSWLPPVTEWAGWVATLLNSPDEVVCPLCLVDRAVAANVSGFNNQKANRVKNALLRHWFCLNQRRTDTRSGHTHLPQFGAEVFDRSRNDPPGPAEAAV